MLSQSGSIASTHPVVTVEVNMFHRRYPIPTVPLALTTAGVSLSGCSLFGQGLMGTWNLVDFDIEGYSAKDLQDYLTAEAVLDFDDKDPNGWDGELEVTLKIFYTYDYYSYDYEYYGGYDSGYYGARAGRRVRPVAEEPEFTVSFKTDVEATDEGGNEFEIAVDGYRDLPDTEWDCEREGNELVCKGDEGIDMVYERQ